MEIEWEDPPESAKRPGQKSGKYDEFAAALKEHPKKWARLPNKENRRETSAEALAQNLRRGKVRGFDGGRWDTAVKGGDVWACYLGPINKKEPEKKPEPPPEREADADPGKVAPLMAPTIRAWAREQGIDVPERGRLPADVVEAYMDYQG